MVAVQVVWRMLKVLCPQCIAPKQPAPVLSEVPRAARRLCILSLLACTQASPSACHTAREHEALHELPRVIGEHVAARASRASPRGEGASVDGAGGGAGESSGDGALAAPAVATDELAACLELLHSTTFPAEADSKPRSAPSAPGSGGKCRAVAALPPHCAPGGRPLDLHPLLAIADQVSARVYALPPLDVVSAATGGAPTGSTPASSSARVPGETPASGSLSASSQMSFEERRAIERHGYGGSGTAAGSGATPNAAPVLRTFLPSSERRKRKAAAAAAAADGVATMADISSTEEASPAGAKPMPSAAERDPFAFDEDDAPPANRSTMRSRLPVKRRAVASDESAPHESPHVAPSPERRQRAQRRDARGLRR